MTRAEAIEVVWTTARKLRFAITVPATNARNNAALPEEWRYVLDLGATVLGNAESAEIATAITVLKATSELDDLRRRAGETDDTTRRLIADADRAIARAEQLRKGNAG